MKKRFDPVDIPTFKRSTLAIAISAMAIGLPQLSFSEEDASEEDVEEVFVTGIRGSLMASQDLKNSASGVVEAVSAEDIGKLPDVSIAESLGRMPGLAAQRLNGRAQVISIRGLDPDFSMGLLNGRMQVSSGDNRGVEFDQYPSELLNAVIVHKTPSASMIGAGIAGTIDMQTIKPLDMNERIIAANVRYEQNAKESLNSDRENSGERATFSFIDQFMDDQLGLALGFSYTNTPTQGERFNAWGYPDVYQDAGGNYTTAADDNGTPNTFVGQAIGGAKPFVQSNTIDRISMMGVLQYEPTDELSVSADFFVSQFEEEQLLRGIELPLMWGGNGLPWGGTSLTGVDAVDGNNLITSGTYQNVFGVQRNDIEQREVDMLSLGVNARYLIDDSLTLVADVSMSQADRVDQILENYSGIDTGAVIDFNMSSKGAKFDSNLDYNGPDVRVMSPQGWGDDFVVGGQKGFYKQPAIEDEIMQIKLSAEKIVELGPVVLIQGGVNYDTRTKNKTTSPQYYFDLTNSNYNSTRTENNTQPIDGGSLPSSTGTTDLSFLGLGDMTSYDPLDFFNSGAYVRVPGRRADISSQNWEVEETVTTAFVQFDIEYEVMEMPLMGNAGFQYVNTDQSSTGISAVGRINLNSTNLDEQPVSGGKTYSNLLPSLNLTLEVDTDLLVRLGLAKTLTRPRIDNLRASQNVSFSTAAQNIASTDIELSPWSSSAGNPELDPWLSNSLDISVENYFEDGGYVAASYFYKDLESYIVEGRTVEDFTGLDTFGFTPQIFTGYNSVVINGDGGMIRGLELSATVMGEMVHDMLEGFGVVASASYTQSSIKPEGTPESRLPGLSDRVFNLTGYYEMDGFAVRLSNRYRSDFVGELAGFDAQRNQRIVLEESVLDAQVSYQFQEGELEGLSILLQANNLTNEPFVTVDGGNEDLILDYQNYGASYALGLSYKF